MSGRYRLLQADLEALKVDGADRGVRDARHAIRLGMSFDSWIGLEAMEMFTANALHREGVSWDELGPGDKATTAIAWNDAYRDAFSETWNDEAPEEGE